MSRNNDYNTRNLLNYSYHQNHSKLFDTDLSRQTNTTIPQQINFSGILGEANGTTIFFHC